MNQSEVDEGLQVPKGEELPGLPLGLSRELSAETVVVETLSARFPLGPSWLRLAYAVEFFIALIAIISVWSEIGGESHLDLMPWYVKLGCIVGLAWCCVRFTANIVEQQKVWTWRALAWFAAIVLLCIAMGATTYYYHLHEQPDEGDQDTTAAAASIRSINSRGFFYYHASTTTKHSIRICLVARAAGLHGDRISVGGNGGNSRLCL